MLRDFARIAGRSGETGRLGSRLLQGGYVLFCWREQGKSAAAFAPLQKRLKRQLQVGTEPGGCRKTAGTCRNLLALWSALWRFLDDPRIPPTNNLAERALRGVVLRRKISYVTRSGHGLRFVERAFAAAYTCRRQGIELFEFLQRALNAKLGNTPAPSLVPAAG
nr:transposase [Chitinimonas sp. BJB300]